MNAAILAGGRGRRLGLLTESAQKAVLYFDGNPLIAHILDTVLNETAVGEIVVLTGYRRNDIHEVLHERYLKEIETGKIRILDFPDVQGTLSRFTSALPHLNLNVPNGWCVCGIDSLVSQTVFHRFCSYTALHQDEVILSFSPRLGVATTHKVGCLKSDNLVELASHEKAGESAQDFLWGTDVGIRYFPISELQKMKERKFANGLNIPVYIQELLVSGKTVRAFLFEEGWKHFALLGDFYGSLAS